MSRPGFFQRLRTYTGFASAWLLHLGGFGVYARNVCTPGFACHGCPWSTFACPIGVMAHGSAVRSLPVLALATVLAVGVSVGRLICGFLCPFGWLQDLLHRIPSPKLRLPRMMRLLKYAALVLLVFLLPFLLGHEVLGYARLAKPAVTKNDAGDVEVTAKVTNPGATPLHGLDLVAVYRDTQSAKETYRSPQAIHFDVNVAPGETKTLPVFAVPNLLCSANLELESPQSALVTTPRYDLYYCKVCPLGTLTAHLPKYAQVDEVREDGIYGKAGKNTLRLSVFVLFLVLMVVASRAFCRLFCPLGAMYGLCSRLAVARVTVDRDSCIQCGQCDKVCPVELDVRREAGGPECIACGDCIKACPRGSIQRRFGL